MTTDALGAAAVVIGILIGLIVPAFKFGRDKHDRIRTYSAAWWIIVLACPWGLLWALCRSRPAGAPEAGAEPQGDHGRE
jgi:hypothetical protein